MNLISVITLEFEKIADFSITLGKKDSKIIEKCDVIENILPLIKATPIKKLHIIGSRCDFCKDWIDSLIDEGKITTTTEINILFRMGDQSHQKKLVDSYIGSLHVKHPMFNFKFYYDPNYHHAFQGVIFNDKIGLVGFLHRYIDVNEEHAEDMNKYILIKKRSQGINNYIVEAFLKCFRHRGIHHKSVEDAINNYNQNK